MSPLRIKRVAFLGFIAIILFVVSLYIALPWLVQALVKSTLSDSQIELHEIEFDRPTWASVSSGTFQLNLLSLRLQDQTEVELRDALIQLDAPDKPSSSVTLINIESIQVRKGEASTTEISPEEVDLSSLLPSVLFDSLPEAQITVNSIVVNESDIQLKKLSVNLSNKSLSAKATLNKGLTKSASDAFKPLLGADISININVKNELQLIVKEGDSKPLLQLDLKLTKLGDSLEGVLQLNSSVSAVDLPIADGHVIAIDDNQLTSSTEFSLPAKQVLSANKIIQFTGLSKVLNTVIISADDRQQSTQFSAEATLKYSLDEGALHLTVLNNKTPAVQLKGNLRRVVFPNDDIAMENLLGSLFATIKKPIIIDYDLRGEASEGLSINGGEFALQYLEKGKRLIDVELSDMDLVTAKSDAELANSFKLKGRIDLDNIINPLALEGLSIGSLNAVINSRVAIQHDQLMIKTSSNNDLRMRSLRFNEHAAKAVSLSLPKQQFSVDLKTHNISKFKFSLNGSNLSSTDFKMKRFGVHSSAGLKNNKMTVHSKTDAMNAELVGESYYIPPIVVNSKLRLDNSSVNKALLELTNICNDPILNASWQPNKRNGHLIDMRWQQAFSNAKPFRKWLNTSILPFDMTGGTFAGHIAVELNDDTTKFRQLDVSLKDVQGIYDKGAFKGVQLQLSSPLQQLATSNIKQAVRFDTVYAQINGTIKEVNMGLKANDIVLKGAIYDRLNDWHLKLPLLKASVFSGLVEVRDEDINFNDDIQLDLIMNQLDLTELVQTQEMEGLQTSGKLSGRIPLQYSNGQISVLDGAMRSNDGGRIRYVTPLSQSGDINEQLKLTLDVLENFNYTTLNSKIVYDNDTLYFKSAISGRNPNVADGRPINLNLNIDVGLKGAIEAMRIQSGIDSHIEEFVGSKVTATNNQYYCQ